MQVTVWRTVTLWPKCGITNESEQGVRDGDSLGATTFLIHAATVHKFRTNEGARPTSISP